VYESDVHFVVRFGGVVCYVHAVIAVQAEVVVAAVEVVLVVVVVVLEVAVGTVVRWVAVVVVGYGFVVVSVGCNFEMVVEFGGLVAVGVAWILVLVQRCF